MDNSRFAQILQNIINLQSNNLSELNNYLHEAISTASNWYSSDEYLLLEEQLKQLKLSNEELKASLASMQEDYQKLAIVLHEDQSESAKANTEIAALRLLVESIRQDRDVQHSVIAEKDSAILLLEKNATDLQSELDASKIVASAQQKQIIELNARISDLLVDLGSKQQKIIELSDTTDEVRSALQQAKDKIKSELQEAISEIDEAIDNINTDEHHLSSKEGAYSDAYYKNGVVDDTFNTPFTALDSGPDVFLVTNPLLAQDDNRYYSYTNGIAKPYGSQIVFFLPDGTPQTIDAGNWGSSYIPQTPKPMQANDGKWYTFVGGVPMQAADSEEPVIIQQIGPRSGSYDVYYTFKNGIGATAEGTFSNGTFAKGVLI